MVAIVPVVAACGGEGNGALTGTAAETQPATGELAESGTIEEPPAIQEGPFVLPDGVLLTVDSTGEEVRALKEALVRLGYKPGPVNETFTTRTRTAVVAFQRDRGLDPDGVVGPLTAAAINEALLELENEG